MRLYRSPLWSWGSNACLYGFLFSLLCGCLFMGTHYTQLCCSLSTRSCYARTRFFSLLPFFCPLLDYSVLAGSFSRRDGGGFRQNGYFIDSANSNACGLKQKGAVEGLKDALARKVFQPENGSCLTVKWERVGERGRTLGGGACR